MQSGWHLALKLTIILIKNNQSLHDGEIHYSLTITKSMHAEAIFHLTAALRYMGMAEDVSEFHESFQSHFPSLGAEDPCDAGSRYH
jgi:hypothetical protein